MTDIPPQQPVIQPSPVEATYRVALARSPDGTIHVAMAFQHPTGQTVLFFDPESAEAFGKAVAETVKLVRSGGLVIPDMSDAVISDLASRRRNGGD